MSMKNLNFESEVSMKNVFFFKIFLISITMQKCFGSSRECDIFHDFECYEIPFRYLSPFERRIHKIFTSSVWRKICLRCHEEHKENVVEKTFFIEIFWLNFTITWSFREWWITCADPEVSFTARDTTMKTFHILWMIQNVFAL